MRKPRENRDVSFESRLSMRAALLSAEGKQTTHRAPGAACRRKGTERCPVEVHGRFLHHEPVDSSAPLHMHQGRQRAAAHLPTVCRRPRVAHRDQQARLLQPCVGFGVWGLEELGLQVTNHRAFFLPTSVLGRCRGLCVCHV